MAKGQPRPARPCSSTPTGSTSVAGSPSRWASTGCSGRQPATRAQTVDELSDHILTSLIGPDHVADDIALVAMRPLSLVGGPLGLALPAEPRMLVEARPALREWLRDCAVATDDESEILVACGEACANVVRHAYATAPGDMALEARITDGLLEVTVRDQGGMARTRRPWRRLGTAAHPWPLDSVDVDSTADGTVVQMRRRLRAGGGR